MTWIISRIHKRVRKNQMEKDMSWKGKEKEFVDGRDLESQGSTYVQRNLFTNTPLHEVTSSRYPADL